MFARSCFFFTTLFCLVPGILFATGSEDEGDWDLVPVACAKSAPQLEKPLEKAPEAQPERARRKPAPVQARRPQSTQRGFAP